MPCFYSLFNHLISVIRYFQSMPFKFFSIESIDRFHSDRFKTVATGARAFLQMLVKGGVQFLIDPLEIEGLS